MFNLKIVFIMIFFLHFVSNTELQECGITAEQLKKLLDQKYPDGRLFVEPTPNGAWLRTFQEADDEHDVSKDFVDSL